MWVVCCKSGETTFSDTPSCSPIESKKVVCLYDFEKALLGWTGVGIVGGCRLDEDARDLRWVILAHSEPLENNGRILKDDGLRKGD